MFKVSEFKKPTKINFKRSCLIELKTKYSWTRNIRKSNTNKQIWSIQPIYNKKFESSKLEPEQAKILR